MRVLLISDVHGNYDALKSVLESARGFDYVWVLGDLVDYGPEPHMVMDSVREIKPEVLLMGNHDYAVAYNTDCRCGQELHDLSMYTRLNISYRLLTRDQLDWLRNLKHYERVDTPLGRAFIVHGLFQSSYSFAASIFVDLSPRRFISLIVLSNLLVPPGSRDPQRL